MLYTGSSDVELLISGLDSGARGYALKEGTPSELTAALNTVAEGGTYVDPRLRPALLSRRATQRMPSLSKREREIMDLLAQGLTGEQVAEQARALQRDRQDPHPQRDGQARGLHPRARDRDRPAGGLHPAAARATGTPRDATTSDRRRLRHDLRTPLTIVSGFAEVLAGDRTISDDDRREYASRIHAAALEIGELVDQLLDQGSDA